MTDAQTFTMTLVTNDVTLNIRSTGDGTLLSWPADSVSYQLYTTTNLCPPTNWIRATSTPVLSNGFWVVALPPGTNLSQFYRLQSP